ncbi:uncharacterized protein LY79DRAFT_111450 [Colletotrichum navitas]|uniref:Uncharacterized protein n=1 Tax=Colletotrichum navitas TaxID=681940 RepID=A0AAD8V7K9_9PEZI|nr:uncharacterized protein LY79DRAFT_111450 [Colletotrichum navitas]KAK1595353.1 hypothetical protein LY79DRAFT_111450 [Colletotrichum navitas]
MPTHTQCNIDGLSPNTEHTEPVLVPALWLTPLWAPEAWRQLDRFTRRHSKRADALPLSPDQIAVTKWHIIRIVICDYSYSLYGPCCPAIHLPAHHIKGGRFPAPTTETGKAPGLALFSDPTECPYQYHLGPHQTVAQRFDNADANCGPRTVTLHLRSDLRWLLHRGALRSLFCPPASARENEAARDAATIVECETASGAWRNHGIGGHGLT